MAKMITTQLCVCMCGLLMILFLNSISNLLNILKIIGFKMCFFHLLSHPCPILHYFHMDTFRLSMFKLINQNHLFSEKLFHLLV